MTPMIRTCHLDDYLIDVLTKLDCKHRLVGIYERDLAQKLTMTVYNISMSKKEKLFRKIQNSQKNVKFDDFCKLMEYFGFVLERIRGSHHLYLHPEIEEVMNVQSKKDGQAKSYQIKQFLKLVESYRLALSSDETED